MQELGIARGDTVPAVRLTDLSPTHLDNFPTLAQAALHALDVTEKTRREYQGWLVPFLAFYEAAPDKALTRDFALGYKRQLIGQGLKPSTVKAYLTVCRRVFAELAARNYAPNIFAGIKSPKAPKGHLRDSLTDADWIALCNVARTDTLTGLRDFALLNVLARTAIRSVEAVRLDVGDLVSRDTKKHGTVRALSIWGKGRAGKDREVVLTPAASAPLQAYLCARGAIPENAALFASHGDRNPGGRLNVKSVSRIVREAMREGAIKTARLSAHSLRRYALNKVLQGGGTVEDAQRLAGHEDRRTTEGYLNEIERLEDGAEWLIRLPGDPPLV